jgi:hypothetical protein
MVISITRTLNTLDERLLRQFTNGGRKHVGGSHRMSSLTYETSVAPMGGYQLPGVPLASELTFCVRYEGGIAG